MPTATKGAGFSIIFLAAFAWTNVFAQQVDTINVRPFEQYWTKPRLAPKIGFGVQETGFGELGVQFHQIYVHPLSLASAGPYLTVDAVFQIDETILGPKVGYEITAGLLGFAADVTYFTDFSGKHLWAATPKAGFTLFGYADLFYGYNLYLSDQRFSAISNNRFSLIFNLNPDYHHIRDAKRKKRRE
jgi:hypothetical protein